MEKNTQGKEVSVEAADVVSSENQDEPSNDGVEMEKIPRKLIIMCLHCLHI